MICFKWIKIILLNSVYKFWSISEIQMKLQNIIKHTYCLQLSLLKKIIIHDAIILHSCKIYKLLSLSHIWDCQDATHYTLSGYSSSTSTGSKSSIWNILPEILLCYTEDNTCICLPKNKVRSKKYITNTKKREN